MNTERQLFKKKSGTGMHMVRNFSIGTKINNQPVQGKAVLRPGNTVYCFANELGIDGLTQFDLVTGAGKVDAVTEQQKEPEKPKETLVLQRRGKSSYYDVINPLVPDKPLNEKALTKAKAETLLHELTEGEAKKEEVDLSELGWDELVKLLEKEGVSWDDDWETEDDLRAALQALNE